MLSFGVGSGESLLVLILFLSEGVFGSSVAFRLEAGQDLAGRGDAKAGRELTVLFYWAHSGGRAGCPRGEVAARCYRVLLFDPFARLTRGVTVILAGTTCWA